MKQRRNLNAEIHHLREVLNAPETEEERARHGIREAEGVPAGPGGVDDGSSRRVAADDREPAGRS